MIAKIGAKTMKRVAKMKTRAISSGDRLVAARIRAARKSTGMTLLAFSKRIGVAYQQVQKYEVGKNRVSPARLQKIADVTGKPITYFFADIGQASESDDTVRLIVKLLGGSPAIRRILEALPVATPKDANLLAKMAERLTAV
jgi:transcriptional regulator with XRE-family HTH domain